MAMDLQQLGLRIDAGDEVKADDVKNVYRNEIQEVTEHYKKLGKEGSVEMTRHVEWLQRARDRLLGKLEELKTVEKGKQELLRKRMLKEIHNAIIRGEQLSSMKDSMQGRIDRLNGFRSWAINVTNPDEDDARIDDYEGWGKDNAASPVRSRLVGYLTGWAMHGQEFADRQFDKAVRIFESADNEWLTTDEILTEENMKKGLKLEPYLKMLAPFGLAAESEGFLAGQLAVADGHLKQQDIPRYREYLLKTLENYGSTLDLPDNKKPADPDYFDIAKGKHQMHVLSLLLSPKEWVAERDGVKDEFQKLKDQVKQVEASLGVAVKDPELKIFLGKDPDELTFADISKIDAFSEQLRAKGAEHVERLVGTLEETHKSVSGEAEKMFQRNESVKYFSDEDIEVVKQRLEYSKKDIGKIFVSESSSLAEMEASVKQAYTARSYLEAILKKVKTMNEELDEAEERKKKEEEETARRREEEKERASKPSGIKAGEKAPESKEVAESLQDFLHEKNLREYTKEDGFAYGIGLPKVKITDGVVSFDWKNTEVNDSFGKQLNVYLFALQGPLSPEKKASLKSMAQSKNVDMNDIFALLGADKGVSEIIDRADVESRMVFLERPSRDGIEKAYTRTFVPAWERAAKRLVEFSGTKVDTSKKPTKRPSETITTRVEVPSELRFLGKVNLLYVDALSAIARRGNDPEGVAIVLPFSSNLKVSGRFRPYEQGGYILNYTGGSRRFGSVEDALRFINEGTFHQMFVDSRMRREGPYEKWEDKVGTLRENKNGLKPGEIWLEFDWTNPNPDLRVKVYPHGVIHYSVKRENIGPYGEDQRLMRAESFDDFMIQMAHLRQWAEGPKHAKRETVGARREILFQTVTNPYNYRNVEDRIGRVVQFGMIPKNEVVSMRLDWGGGNKAESKQNALLNVWVTKEGRIAYILNGPGAKKGRRTVNRFEDMIDDVAANRR